ncbi:rhamnan synthesis F family protein [Aurantibacillus circumpalustris]|uniref:rhamnan synthesis F family protein n=1 Tax=Aurantibacillus circumpalustris TaxID=3036359 RepID=UPI00295B11BA|nr:rhamnan synthesis F family protein [Aurantibacillus circumpalustris]
MKSLCLFASYFTKQEIPYYITVYLKELKKHYTEVVFLTSQEKLSPGSLQFLESENLALLLVENKGFDFGQWYQAFRRVSIHNYDQIVLVNDSCILFKPLDEFITWSATNKADVQGITLSEAIYPHIQSYFLVLNKKAIALTWEYFQKHKIKESISDVIHTYEVGLNKFLQEQGLKIAAFIDNNGYKGEFSPYYYCVDYHLSKGIPLIKKKIIFSSYRRSELSTLARMIYNINPNDYLTKISKEGKNLIIDLKRLIGVGEAMTKIDRINYSLLRLFYRVAKPIYKLIKGT